MKPGDIDQEFLELVNRYQPVIHKVCWIYADSLEDRQDLFQEILFQLWRSYPSFQGKSNFSTWMYRIALNRAITALRRETAKPEHVELDAERIETPAAAVAPTSGEQVELLYRLIRKLSRVERALVMLYLEDLSYREMSEVLGLSESNIGVKLNRIKAKLQELAQEAK